MDDQLTAAVIDQALAERLDEIRRTLPRQLQEAAALQARLMADQLRDMVRKRRAPRWEVSSDGRSFRCY